MIANPDCSRPTTSATAAARTSRRLTRTTTSPSQELNDRDRNPPAHSRSGLRASSSGESRSEDPPAADSVHYQAQGKKDDQRREVERHTPAADRGDHPAKRTEYGVGERVDETLDGGDRRLRRDRDPGKDDARHEHEKVRRQNGAEQTLHP